MGQEIKIFNNSQDIAQYLSFTLEEDIFMSYEENRCFCIALSGGNTPKIIFQHLADSYLKKEIIWDIVHFFWSDERCVPPYDPDSNYGMAYSTLLEKLRVSKNNIHRIKGENAPQKEVIRYSEEIRKKVLTLENNIPCFDYILLGLGNDGHTASLFPGTDKILDSESLCEVSQHPSSGQNRITFTPKLINNAKKVVFIVTGKDKAEIVSTIINSAKRNQYPASLINPGKGQLLWLLDTESFSK